MTDNENNPFSGKSAVSAAPTFGKLPAAEENIPPVSAVNEEAKPSEPVGAVHQESYAAPIVTEEPKPVYSEKSTSVVEAEEKPLAHFMQTAEAPKIEPAKDDIFSEPEEDAFEEPIEEELHVEANAGAGEEAFVEQEPVRRKKSSPRILGFLIILGAIGAGVYFSGLLHSDPVPTLPLVASPMTPAPSTSVADGLPPVAPQETKNEMLPAPVDASTAPSISAVPMAPSAVTSAREALPVVPVKPTLAPAPSVVSVVQESAKDICEKHMTEHAVQNHADAKTYIAQNPDYVKQCVDQVQAWQSQQKKK